MYPAGTSQSNQEMCNAASLGTHIALFLGFVRDHALQFLSAEEHTDATPQALHMALNMH